MTILNNTKKSLKKAVEFIGLLLLQIVSLATTLEGSKLIFGNEKMPFAEKMPEFFTLAFVLGFGIQLLLTIILVFNGFEKVPIRRLIALFLLSIFSIYTNFFSIYNNINGKLLEKNTSIDLAQRKYGELVQYFYKNPKGELNELQTKRKNLECSLYQEDPKETPNPDINNCRDSGFNQGKGETYKRHKAELEEVKKKLSEVPNENYLKEIDKQINKSSEEKNAKDFYDDSKTLLGAVNSNIKKEAEKKGFNPKDYDNIEDFLPKSETSYFLIPARKIFTSEENRDILAVVALVVAAAIDGISLLLGARLHGFYTSLKESLGSINPIADIFNGLFIYLQDIGKSVVPFIKAPFAYLGQIWLSFAEGGGMLITGFFNGLKFLLSSLLNGIFGLFKYSFKSLQNQHPEQKLYLEKKNGNGVEFLDNLCNAILKGRSDSLNQDSNNSQLYRVLISDMREKGYFGNSSATSNNSYDGTNTSIPNRFNQENHQQDLILKSESKGIFLNWYINQRNLQLEREKSNVGDRDYSLNIIDFPPDYQRKYVK